MQENVPISKLVFGEDACVVVTVTTVRERRTQQGNLFWEARARNAGGTLALKIRNDSGAVETPIKPGLWRLTGRLESFQDRIQFAVAEYEPITLEQYREHQGVDPVLPRAYTIDIETLALEDYRERIGPHLERSMRLGNMRVEQQQRYLEDIAAEEDRCYQLGALSAATGRVLCIAVHVGPIPGQEFEGVQLGESEVVFGIDEGGNEQDEKQTLTAFLDFMRGFDPDTDEIVGHNIIGFDLPFIFQRCLTHCLKVRPFVDLGEHRVRGVFDTMHQWWLGARRTISLDDLAWALGLESSKTAEVEGSKVFELYAAGRLAAIREYNLNDVRLTRKIYERMIICLGR